MKCKHHYGWVDIGTQSPYQHVRETHDFLDDKNHEYEDTGSSIIIRRNQNSPSPHALSPLKGDYWFSVPYTT